MDISLLLPQVDKAIGTDCGFLSEEDFLMGFDDSQEIDLDTISQISAMDSASQTGGGSMVDYVINGARHSSKSYDLSRSVSVGELPLAQQQQQSSQQMLQHPPHHHRRGQFPYAYIRSKLSVLPEEQAGQLSRRESMNNNDAEKLYHAKYVINQTEDDDDELDEMSECASAVTTRSEIVTSSSANGSTTNNVIATFQPSLRMRRMALRRKRSLSVADIPAPRPPAGFEDSGNSNNFRNQNHVFIKAEESGYDSDATRKSSPRGSLKNDISANGGNGNGNSVVVIASSSTDTSDSMSSKSDDSGNSSQEGHKQQQQDETNSKSDKLTNIKPDVTGIKKPPRKSKLPEATFRTTSKPSSNVEPSRLFKKNGEDENSTIQLPLDFAEGLPSALPSLTSKRFKMLRLRKEGSTTELGIVISKKRHPHKGTTGYIIAHIEENGLVER